MTLQDIQLSLQERAKNINASINFKDDCIEYCYIGGFKPTSLFSNVLIENNELFITPFQYKHNVDEKKCIIFMDILEYWVQYAISKGITNLTIQDVSLWEKDVDIELFLSISVTAGFTIDRDKDIATLHINDYLSSREMVNTIETFADNMFTEKPYGRFQWNPWYSSYDDNEFFRFVGYLNSFMVNLIFYRDKDECYFKDIKNEVKVFFTEETLSSELHLYFKDLLEENKMKILIDPPDKKLYLLLDMLPTTYNITKSKDVMISLLGEGYHYNDIEEYCIKLLHEHERQKFINNAQYLTNDMKPKYITAKNSSLGFGRFHILKNDAFVKFPHHYLLLTNEIEDDSKAKYVIFNTQEEMVSYIQEQAKLIVLHTLKDT